jgi:hypothetical protein
MTFRKFFKIAFLIGAAGFASLVLLAIIATANRPPVTPAQQAAINAAHDAQVQTELRARAVKEEAARAEAKAAQAEAARTVELLRPMKWWKGGFDSVMMADVKIRNNTATAVKDIVISCSESGPSRTVIDHNAHTVFDIVKPGQTRTFREVNLGLIRSQATEAACKVASFDKVE